MTNQDANFIHPEDSNNLSYWAKRLGISSRQLADSILDTGNVSVPELKNYLRRNVYFYSPLFGVWKLLKSKFVH